MIGNGKAIISWLFQQDREKIFEIKEKKDKRSLNSNSYCWKLCTLIAEETGTSKEEIYLQMLKDYGVSMLVPLSPNKTLEGYSKYYELVDSDYLNGKPCNWYKIYKGSSTYDTREMSRLIEGIVYEAKNLGIPTLEEYKLKRMIEEWEERYK